LAGAAAGRAPSRRAPSSAALPALYRLGLAARVARRLSRKVVP
ncbi:MAG: hypothetical protein JWN08_1603, partial [Frankiales bacterium]|nr:hypothetical protein [Frankiales bacterium]